MYSPRVSPSRPNTHTSPSKHAISSTQSEEYLYSIAQLTAHSGVKTPGIRGDKNLSIPLGEDFDDERIERLRDAARLLKRDLANNPRSDTYIFHDPIRPKKYEPTCLLPSTKSPVPVLAISDVIRPATSPKVPMVEMYDGKSGRRLPVSGSSPVSRDEVSSIAGSDMTPKRTPIRAQNLNTRLQHEILRVEATEREREWEREKEREQSYTDSEGYSDKMGGQDSPAWEEIREREMDGEDRGDFEGPELTVQDPKGLPVVDDVTHTESYTVLSSPRSRERSRSPWEKRRVSMIPLPTRRYRSPDKMRPHELEGKPAKVNRPCTLLLYILLIYYSLIDLIPLRRLADVPSCQLDSLYELS